MAATSPRWLVPIAVALVTVSACTSSGGSHQYPGHVRANFVYACVEQGAAGDECDCVVSWLENNMPFARFVELELKMTRTGTMPDELVPAIAACLS